MLPGKELESGNRNSGGGFIAKVDSWEHRTVSANKGLFSHKVPKT